MGTTLREIIYDIGGGILDGRPFKAVQTGGPSGGCIPAEFLDSPVSYESLIELGSFMGSGGMIVMDDQSCMVDVAKYFMDFCRDESCGKCVPCRVGTTQLWMLLDLITRGRATMADLERLERLAGVVQRTSFCGLGQGAPNPIFSTLRYFRDEYLAHIVDKRLSRRRLCHRAAGGGSGMTTVYTLTIDGRDVAGTEGQTIMDVAEENGIDIPGLCHLPGIHDRGACRLCVVRDRRLAASSPRPARRRSRRAWRSPPTRTRSRSTAASRPR